MSTKIKRKRLFEAGEQPVQNNNQQQQQNAQANTNNVQNIIQKISNLQVAAVQALQETYKKVSQDIPELDAAIKDQNSPINKEAREFMDAVNGFTQGNADVNKPETITAAMTSYGNIADKLKNLITKISGGQAQQQQNQQQPQQQANNSQQQQPVQQNQPQQQSVNNTPQQPVQQPANNQQQQQPAQTAQNTSERRKYSNFGTTLNEKLRHANFIKMLNSIEEI